MTKLLWMVGILYLRNVHGYNEILGRNNMRIIYKPDSFNVMHYAIRNVSV